MRKALVLVAFTGMSTACAGEGAKTTDHVAISVAPLNLPGVGYVCYDLEVSTPASTVWAEGDPAETQAGQDQTVPVDPFGGTIGTGDTATICSDVYGNGGGGDITYIGPCDSQEDSDGSQPGTQNTVTVWVDGLYESDGDTMGEWQDPCPSGCSLEIDCVENADTSAVFDLTIMREANQGFFDIVVNFEDIFCSSKIDTCYENETPATGDDRRIELLFGADDVRDWTAVVGFACSAGADDDTNTTLLFGNMNVTCGTSPNEVVFPIDPTLPQGNAAVAVDGHVLHYGVYYGEEELQCPPNGSCNKQFWNLALSVTDMEGFALNDNCTLSFEATANDNRTGQEGNVWSNGTPIDVGLAYPYAHAEIGFLNEEGEGYCQTNPLNDSAYTTVYHGSVGGVTAPQPMCYGYANNDPIRTGARPCYKPCRLADFPGAFEVHLDPDSGVCVATFP